MGITKEEWMRWRETPYIGSWSPERNGFLPLTLLFVLMIKVLSWNCRGAASTTFPGRIRDLLRENKADILVLLETRVSGWRAEKIVARLGFSNWIRLEATGYAGGIWILWHEAVTTVTYIHSSTQFIHTKVWNKRDNTEFWLTGVYAEPSPKERLPLWADLQCIATQCHGPWLLIGDFNAYMSCSDKHGGAQPNAAAMRQFHDCIQSANLVARSLLGTDTLGKRIC